MLSDGLLYYVVEPGTRRLCVPDVPVLRVPACYSGIMIAPLPVISALTRHMHNSPGTTIGVACPLPLDTLSPAVNTAIEPSPTHGQPRVSYYPSPFRHSGGKWSAWTLSPACLQDVPGF